MFSGVQKETSGIKWIKNVASAIGIIHVIYEKINPFMVPMKVSKLWVNFLHHYKHKIFGCVPYTLRFCAISTSPKTYLERYQTSMMELF